MLAQRIEKCFWRGLMIALLIVGLGHRADAEEKAATEKTLLILKPDASVTSLFVRVSDLLDIPSDPKKLAQPLKDMLIGLSPKKGDVRHITRAQVLERLSTQGLSKDDFRLEGSLLTVIYKSQFKTKAKSSSEELQASKKKSKQQKNYSFGDEVIFAGERIRLLADRGIVVLEDPGEALEDGRPSDLIEVKNLRSGAIVLARVIRKGVAAPQRIISKTGKKDEGRKRGSR